MELQRIEQAARLHVGDQLALGLRERQAGEDLRPQGQVELLRLEVPAGDRAGPGVALDVERPVRARPVQPVAGLEAQLLRFQRERLRRLLQHQPAADPRQRQLGQAGRDAQLHRAQAHVQRQAARLAAVHVQPGAQRAVALVELEGQVHVTAQLADVGARQVGEELPAPALHRAGPVQQRLGELAAQGEALAPAGRRCRVQPQPVAAQAVAQHQVEVEELQRRRGAQLVDPADAAVEDDELVLLEEPVGRGLGGLRVGRAVDAEAGDEDAALRVAAQQQLGAVQQQLGETQFEGQQRARRQRGADAGQVQRLPAGGLDDAHVAQVQRGDPSGRSGADGADLHGYPQCLGGLLFELGPPVVDVRQNRPVQCQPGRDQQGEQAQRSQAEPEGAACPPASLRDRGTGVRTGDGGRRHVRGDGGRRI